MTIEITVSLRVFAYENILTILGYFATIVLEQVRVQ